MKDELKISEEGMLKRALARMATGIEFNEPDGQIYYRRQFNQARRVMDMELLAVCREIEMGLGPADMALIATILAAMKPQHSILSASWQQRTRALARLKGVEL